MSNFKKLLATYLLVLVALTAIGQKRELVSEMYLAGKWHAECATEVVNKAAIRNCELCPFVIDPANKSGASLRGIDMDFGTDSLTLIQNGQKTTVPYSRNPDNHSFSFSFRDKPYAFRVFFFEDKKIIENSDGMLLVLTRID